MSTSATYVPIENVAEYFSVSVSTIRAWVRQDRIPKNTYIKVGNTYRYCIPEILDALTYRFNERDEIPEKEEDKIVPIMRRPVATEETGQVINFDSLDEDQ
jgi:predicted DNA-binding transcriptional regulator AlpA